MAITKKEVNDAGWDCVGFLDFSGTPRRAGRIYQNKKWPDLQAFVILGEPKKTTYRWRDKSYKTGDELLAAMNQVLTGGKPQGEK